MTLVVGALISLVLGFTSTYLATPGWGSLKDVLATATWSFGLSGAVNLARTLSLRVDQLFSAK